MTARLTITLALAALLTASSCAADIEAPAGPQTPAKREETHSTRPDAPAPHDHVLALDILDKVNAFYDSAWTKLVFAINLGAMLVVGLLGGVFGVIMPLLARRRQSKTFDRAKDDLETKIDSLAAKAEKDVTTAQDQMLAQVENAMKESKAALGALAGATRKEIAAQGFLQGWQFFSVFRRAGHDPRAAFHAGGHAICACLAAGSPYSDGLLEVLLKDYVGFIREVTPKAVLAASDLTVEIVEGAIAELEKYEISEQAQDLAEELKKAVSEAKRSKPVDGTDSAG